MTPRELFVETAKFFMINPQRWMKGGLVGGIPRGSKLGDPSLDNSECRFCAVGYMAHLIKKENPNLRNQDDYGVVTDALQGTGLSAERIYPVNDQNGFNAVVNFLRDQAVATR